MTAPPTTKGERIPICFVIGYFDNPRAGTEGHLLRLLDRLDRDRFDPRLVVMQRTGWTDRFSDPRTPMDVLEFQSFSKPGDWRCIKKLRDIFKSHGTQVVELHMIDAHFGGVMAAKWAGVPVVLSCRRDLGHQYDRKMLWMSRLVNPFVTRFLANSQEVVRKISALEHLDAARFDVICNGVDLPAFDQDTTQSISPIFAAAIEGKKVVSVAANLFKVKNHATLLRAAQLVSQQVDDVIFAFLGEGPCRAELEQQTHDLGLTDQVLWLGSQSHVASYLVKSDVGCLASKSEGFSNAIVEYMAAGLPVVATSVGGAAELIKEGETGYMVGPEDMQSLAERLIQLLKKTDFQRQAMGAAGRQHVNQNFSMKSQMASFEELYAREVSQARK